MQHLGSCGGAHKAGLAGTFAGLLLAVAAHTAAAQGAPTAGTSDNAPSEAARRAAASPYRFIIQSSTAPRRAAAPAEPRKAPAPPVQQASVQPRALAQPSPAAPPPEAAPAPAVAPAPAPEPAVAALSRKPAEPPPVRREIIPVRTDEPRLSPALLREEPHGTVKVQFDIEPDGSVGEVKVVSSTNRSLNKPTLEAVGSWKFQPVDETLTVQTEVVYNLDQQ